MSLPAKLTLRQLTGVFMVFLLFLVGAATSYAQQPVDILLKGGHVIDPKNNINGVMDVAISEGKILSLAQNITEVHNLL